MHEHVIKSKTNKIIKHQKANKQINKSNKKKTTHKPTMQSIGEHIEQIVFLDPGSCGQVGAIVIARVIRMQQDRRGPQRGTRQVVTSGVQARV